MDNIYEKLARLNIQSVSIDCGDNNVITISPGMSIEEIEALVDEMTKPVEPVQEEPIESQTEIPEEEPVADEVEEDIETWVGLCAGLVNKGLLSKDDAKAFIAIRERDPKTEGGLEPHVLEWYKDDPQSLADSISTEVKE